MAFWIFLFWAIAVTVIGIFNYAASKVSKSQFK